MSFGALFDWDGTVIDSSAYHERSWDVLAAEENLPLFEGHFKMGFGQKNQDIIPNILKWTEDPDEIERLALRKEEIYREDLRAGGLEALPGVIDLLKALHENDIPCAVGSSTTRLNINTVMEILGIEKYFQAIVCGDDVTNGKPNPEVFLKGAERINVAPDKCIVFEDAQVGIDAGVAGGMKIVAIGTTTSLSNLKHGDISVETLADLSFEDLKSLF